MRGGGGVRVCGMTIFSCTRGGGAEWSLITRPHSHTYDVAYDPALHSPQQTVPRGTHANDYKGLNPAVAQSHTTEPPARLQCCQEARGIAIN